MSKKAILIDTGFWLGLFDPEDSYHKESCDLLELIKLEHFTLLLPFPCLYEIIRTKYVKNKVRLAAFDSFIKSNNVHFIFDELYRDQALQKVFALNKHEPITHSLVDSIIREMISDINLKLDYLITNNAKDFADICAKRDLKILS